MSPSMNLLDAARCRARIAGMQDEELDDYILRVKTRLVQSREDFYFLEESLLLQLGEACEERKRRQTQLHIVHHRQVSQVHEQCSPSVQRFSR
jgi:hypothetical protein